jgi:NDP-sugar pyrophosphorylase family protein
VNGLILAGGEGTRLRPLTTEVPKPIVPVANVPLLAYQVDLLRRAGIDDVTLSLGHQAARVEAEMRSSDLGAGLHYSAEETPLGTAGAYRLAAARIHSSTVVFNGDGLVDLDVAAVVAMHRARGAEATIVVARVQNPAAFGVVETTSDGWITRFAEKSASFDAGAAMVNAGVYVLEPSILAAIPRGQPYSFEREVFPALLREGRPVLAFVHDGYWTDIGTPRSYLEANHDVLAGRFTSPRIPHGGVPRVELGQDTFVDERSIIGEQVAARAGVRIVNSVIGPGCVLGEGAEVIDSVLWPRTVVPAGDRVESSIVSMTFRVSPFASR